MKTFGYRTLVLIGVVALFATNASGADRVNRDVPAAIPEWDHYDRAIENYRTRPTQQIINGLEAMKGEIPWQASLQVASIPDPHRGHFCGGVIYSKDWIITAAHCVIGRQPGDLKIAVGIVELSTDIPRYDIDRILIKPGFQAGRTGNDVALLHMKSALLLSRLIQPIPLVSDPMESGFVNQSTPLTASGWGADEPGGLAVSHLLKVVVPFASPTQCTGSLSYPPDPVSHEPQITGQMLCAGKTGGGVDTCQGDSGGPLVYFAGGHPSLVGIASWGDGCALPYKFGVYARLSQFRGWIAGSTRN
jgi:secreted trypsin-like serine protease